MIQNIVIGKPLIEPWKLISESENEFNNTDNKYTMYTQDRFLPSILVKAGIVKSISEVRRNKPDLCVTLDTLDCIWVKWGKNKIYVIVGK